VQPDLQIRGAGPADAGEILTLQRAAYVTEAQLYGEPFLPALVQTLEELRAELSSSLALAAMLGPRMVGSVRAAIVARTLHIGRLSVAPDLQGQGIGTRLLHAVEELGGDRVEMFTLFTGDRSAANIRLYERLGYVQSRHEELRPGLGLVHLTKPAPARQAGTSGAAAGLTVAS
jgi:GNAT superfamily N-acetyltransferase